MSGIKQNLSLGFIDGLSHNTKKVLETLLVWDYAVMKSSPFFIATHIGISESCVVKCLRYLKFRGIVAQSHKGSYLVTETIKKRLMQESDFQNSILSHVKEKRLNV